MAVAAVDIGAEGMTGFDLSPCPRFSYPEDFDRPQFDAWPRLPQPSMQCRPVPRCLGLNSIGAAP